MLSRATYCVLMLLLTVNIAGAADPKPDVPAKPLPATAEAARFEKLQEQLQTIIDDLSDLRKRADINEKGRTIEMDLIKGRLEKLEKAMETLKTSPRISSSFTPGNVEATGVIQLMNRSAVPTTIVLAGKAYPLAPFQTAVLSGQPAGNFTYEVLAEGFGVIRPAVTRALASGETFAITVNP